MKKIAVLLAAVMMLTMLAACGGSDVKTINSPDDFEGAKITVQNETTADESISEMVDGGLDVEVIRLPVVIDCFNELKAGRVDAVYVDSVVAAFYTTGNDAYNRVWLSDEDEPLGICLAKGSENLRNAIDSAVDMLYFNGIMTEIGERHFGGTFDPARNVSSAPELLPVNDEDLIKPGTLMIGVEIGYPPMEYYAEDGTTAIGFDIDVGKAIAELLGLKAEFVNTEWDGIFAGLGRPDYDCIISSVSITPDREREFIFTRPYIANALCIVVLAEEE